VDKAVPGKTSAMPEDFTARHTKHTAGSDDPNAFLTKDEYLRIANDVRIDTRRIIDGLAPEDFDQPINGGVPPFVKNTGQALLFVASHWLWHAGQWVAVRHKLGRPALF
jgi:hypothetical protein